MKKLLFALALTSFVAGSAVAHDGDKTAKKGEAKKECTPAAKASCSKEMAAGTKPSCCAHKNKTASLISAKPEAKAETAERAAEPKKATL
jgi:hypothetical protein